jgi:putative phosphoribosyl transferase
MTTQPIDHPTSEATEPVPLPFEDRLEAARLLTKRLAGFRGQHALVLGIPRGGVPVAREVALGIEGELDIVVARKLGAPGHEELAIGAVASDGTRYLNQELIGQLGVSTHYLEQVTREQHAEAARRETRFRGGAKAPDLKDRVVILVDDGLATGATMRAAIRAVRGSHPRKLIVAVPVGARDTCRELATEVDEVVCLTTPEPFCAIGWFYRHFEAVPDEQVEAILRQR